MLNLETLYALTTQGNSSIRCGAPWYGNEEQIRLRISKDIEGTIYNYNKLGFELLLKKYCEKNKKI